MVVTSEKVPYTQCLYHTSKVVYKYWVCALATIGVIIGLGVVVSSSWQQIVDGFKYVSNIFNQTLSIAYTIPWYWWVAIGAVIGPFGIAAIYCAWKRMGENNHLIAMIIAIATITCCAFIFCINVVIDLANNTIRTPTEIIIACFCVVWLLLILVCGVNNSG